MLIPALGLALLGFVAYLGIGLGGRLAGRAGLVGPAGIAVAVIGLVTVIGLHAYFVGLLMSGETELGPIVAGRPLPWLVLQGLAVLGVLTIGRVMITVYGAGGMDGGRSRFGVGLLAFGSIAWLPWAVYWGLLRP